MMKHEYGKHLVESKLEEIVTIIEGIKDGSTNLQVKKNFNQLLGNNLNTLLNFTQSR